MVKVRLQLLGETLPSGASRPSPLSLGRQLVAEHGLAYLWKGVGAGYIRQVVYGSSRLGLFRTFSDALKSQRAREGKKEKNLPLHLKVAAGTMAGALASAVGSPADLVLIRLQSDQTLPAGQRRNYKGVGDALVRIVREEGFLGLWRGATPTIIRAMCLNAAMMSTADHVKESVAPLVGGEKTIAASTLSAAASGVASAVASLPADLVKTRLQRMARDPVTGTLPYKGFWDCARSIAAKEGLGAFYVGIGTYIFRIAPHAFFTLIFMDFFQSVKDRVKKGKGTGS
jgi:solute carrier family 25 oxoglutarate transporter 11